MKAIVIIIGLGVVAGAVALASSSSASSPASSTGGFHRDGWYRLVVRSSMSTTSFGVDAPRQQMQAMLGREGFDLRTSTPDPNDPFVYHLVGVYRGDTGRIVDPPGVIVLGASPASPEEERDSPGHLDARPIELEPGTTYRARASIAWPLSMLVTHSAVVSKLTDLGFTDILVVFDAKELPDSWPVSERGGDLFVTATYNGPKKLMEVPSQLLSVWTS